MAGVGSGLPVWSYACTENVCVPFDRPVYCCGELQAVTLPSSVHWKKEAGSEAVNEKVASLLAVLSGGPSVMIVSGAWSVEAKSGPQNVPEARLPNHAISCPFGGRGQRA